MNQEQYEWLLSPIPSYRVASRPQGGVKLAYVEAWDVKAHLIRLTGFGGFSADVVACEPVFAEENSDKTWHVCYRARVRLTLHNFGVTGQTVTYTEEAAGSARSKDRGEATDNAIKNAESDALKRAAIYLGTQFGLSLYNKGSRADVVRETFFPPPGYEAPMPVQPEDMHTYAEQIKAASKEEMRSIWTLLEPLGALDQVVDEFDGEGMTLRAMIYARLEELQEEQ